MGALATHGKQVALMAVVLALAYSVAVAWKRPTQRAPDRDDWCAGYRFGWAHENCAQGGDCNKTVPPCPAQMPLVRGSSLVAGVEAGIYYADEVLGKIADRPDDEDDRDRPYGY